MSKPQLALSDVVVYVAKCPTCDSDKFYKSEKNLNDCKDKNCRSCSNSISRGGVGNVNPINGIKTCIDCEESLYIDEFYAYPSGKVYSVCKKCSHKRNSLYHKEFYRFKKYGITKDDFNDMLDDQELKCWTCKETKNLYIDHHHETGKVRGLLCRDCNSALGLLKENVKTISNLLKYLDNERG